ncbi:threonine--tRNA ligase [Candidatus Peregrinibacteria bacterium]|nr:threonine--tRNA ligase [Candidatus Peregrinibacteria bacterium]
MNFQDILEEKMSDDPLHAMRHSCSHVLAQAVLQMFPEAKLGIGPAIENGFYYDFELPRTLIPEDLPLIEKHMRKIAQEKQLFKRYSKPTSASILFLKKIDQKYKVELAKDLKKDGEKELSFYENVMPDGTPRFVDMCRGPHVEHTGKVGEFKLTHAAGAYWRGSEKNPMLQRIYGVCFPTKKELDTHLAQLEEAKKRDHRKLGKELELFTFSDNVGPGLPLWLPKGGILIEELEKLTKEEEFKAGYSQVRTPHLTKGKLYELSGHLKHYKDSMYPAMKVDDEEYYVKPMNCPHHHMCYSATPKSYRDLPLRYAEYGTCYRYEDSGALFGLMRVRSLQMNDAHIYCSEDQFENEFIGVINLYLRYFKLFGIEKYVMRFSLHDPAELGNKYVDEPKLWIKTENLVRKAIKKAQVPVVEVANEAAFYGPKIDVQIWSAIGREFTLATNQVDFAVPKRMGLYFIDEKGKEQTPLVIHRAPLGTHERFIGFLIEHFGGAFPLWLAPVQIQIIPVSDKHLSFARKLRDDFFRERFRVEIDDTKEGVGKKIRKAELMKIPYMLVVGDQEAQEKKLTVRSYKTKEQTKHTLEDFIEKIREEYSLRKS